MAEANGAVAGFLVINVLEAAGHDSDDAVVWEPEFKNGYARGGRGRDAGSPGSPRRPRGGGSGGAPAAGSADDAQRAGCAGPRCSRAFGALPDPWRAVEIRGGAKTIRVGWGLCLLAGDAQR